MKDRPIIFRGDGVLAILADNKTQTRRIIKFPSCPKWMQAIEHQAMKVAYPMLMGGWVFWDSDVGQEFSDKVYQNAPDGIRCPYGEPGDRHWCKETWAPMCRAAAPFCYCDKEEAVANHYTEYKADTGNLLPGDWPAENREDEGCPKWRSPIFMPRWASRITLEIVSIRVERVQDITFEDCVAEGIAAYTAARGVLSADPPDKRWKFIELWNSINEKRGFGWETNCWVWILEFKRIL